MTGPELSLVTVVTNEVEDVKRLAPNVLARTVTPFEWILVDNSCDEAIHHVLEAISNEDERVMVIRNPQNEGWSRAVNTGVRFSTASEWIAISNPDILMPKSWDRMLIDNVRPGVGAVGPISNFVSKAQQCERYAPPELQNNGPVNVETLFTTFAEKNAGKSIDTKLLITFLVLMPALVARNYPLDENLFFGHDDLDLSWRLRLAGLELRVALDCFVYHRGHAAFESSLGPTASDPLRVSREDEDRMIRESRLVFDKKLAAHYGEGKVPSSTELWDVSWFRTGG